MTRQAICERIEPTGIVPVIRVSSAADLCKVVPCLAVGGPEYLKAGADALRLGSALVDSKLLLESGPAPIRERVRQLTQIVADTRDRMRKPA